MVVLLFLKIDSIASQDVTYVDLDILGEHDVNKTIQVEGKSIPRIHKYVDIYTNVPDTRKVLSVYETMKRTSPQKNVSADRNRYDYTIHRSPRPRFRTSKRNSNFTESTMETLLPFTHVQKIANQRPPLPIGTQTAINEILKKYIAKLYAQKQNSKKRQQRKHQVATIKKKVQSKFLEEPWRAFKNKTMKFANKFLSLFTIIEFPNSRCQATSASSVYDGICYHRTECENLNGTAIGQCANGYGVCCVCKCFIIIYTNLFVETFIQLDFPVAIVVAKIAATSKVPAIQIIIHREEAPSHQQSPPPPPHPSPNHPHH